MSFSPLLTVFFLFYRFATISISVRLLLAKASLSFHFDRTLNPMMMAAALISAGSPSIPLGFCCSQNYRKQALCLSPSAVFFEPRNPRSRFCRSIHLISHWNGLKHLGVSTLRNYRHKVVCISENKGKCRGRVVYASLFGVGAPEALVIGVVALLIFGPKGLAEVARNLGQTLRAFQPTIRELQDVSREFKSSLEREIGLDEIASSTNNIYKSTSPVNQNQQDGKLPTKSSTSEELLKTTEEELTASAIRPNQESSSLEAQTQAAAAAAATATSEAAATIKPEAASPSVSPETATAQIPTSSSDIADSVR